MLLPFQGRLNSQTTRRARSRTPITIFEVKAPTREILPLNLGPNSRTLTPLSISTNRQKMTSRWVVHKFGGTSVANAAGYQAAARILQSLRQEGDRMAVVVSAMSGVTDSLIELVELAAHRNESYLKKLQTLKQRHLDTMAELGLSPQPQQSLAETLANDFKNIEEVLRGIWITGLPSERTKEFVAGHGELWS